MARRLMVVLALVATVAQAQEAAKTAEGTAKGAVLPKGEQRAVLAARSVPGLQTGPLAPSTGSRDGGVEVGSVTAKGTPGRPTDCSGVETMLGNDVPAVRTYPAPPPARTGQPNDWGQAPYVAAVQRCGNLYVIQVLSRSAGPWVVATAKLQGPNGETLHVNARRFRRVKGDCWVINVIVAEAPPGVTVPNFKLDLVGEDGRSAQIKAGNLP